MTLLDWFNKARQENFAIGAFNVDNLEIFKGIILGAGRRKSPVIVEFSPGEAGYFGLKNIIDMVYNAKNELKLPIFLNLDHGKPFENVMEAINLSEPGRGFDEVHFDGSDLEIGENISQAKKVVEAAHKKGIIVEGEINKIGGSSEVHTDDVNASEFKKSYTKPEEAQRFVEETGVDILAPFFGNLHGTFPVELDLDIDLISKIHDSVGEKFLALHGGSGIAATQVKDAIKSGRIVKVNVNTELRSTYKEALEEKLAEKPNEYKIYDLMPDVINSVAAVVEDKMDVFGSSNKV